MSLLLGLLVFAWVLFGLLYLGYRVRNPKRLRPCMRRPEGLRVTCLDPRCGTCRAWKRQWLP